ncbi:hypothetical protein NC99_39830 [Sunxiuqinia dokdonensis]|uniref:Uncharacterized protein n=1 Tax=Sunxiuqinia dokdonensis TaxID=1409788 RepID=A0A0L8V4D1_9BACT|nr:hypothetical protein NC99_39830 [Sunxiuqinia dokdonensis]
MIIPLKQAEAMVENLISMLIFRFFADRKNKHGNSKRQHMV